MKQTKKTYIKLEKALFGLPEFYSAVLAYTSPHRLSKRVRKGGNKRYFKMTSWTNGHISSSFKIGTLPMGSR